MDQRIKVWSICLLIQLYSAGLFLDANNGLEALIDGGFPVIQVELFDLIILIVTVLFMMSYMPYKESENINCSKNNSLTWWKCLLAGVWFSVMQ